MKVKWGHFFASMLIVAFSVFPSAVSAQTTTAEIRGTVVDPQSYPVPNATVTVKEQNTNETRRTTTDASGGFVFVALVPGTYGIQIEASGFKMVQQSGVQLSASEKRSVGSIALSIGAVTDSVTVEANAVQVQIASGENSALVTNDQIQNLQSRGRDIVTFLRVLPGVNGAADNDAAGGAFGTGTPTINGVRQNFNNVTIDGQNRMNTDVTGTDDALLSMDAIQEVKVLTNGYQAEYGRNAGGTVNIVTKGGTRSFHGTGYEFFRNEALNANTFQRKQNPLTAGGPALYRYNTFGGTVGGPIFIPGKLNTNRDKLFFFFNIEKFLITTPGALLTSQLPTAAERSGDFSQSGLVGSSKTAPKDPLTGLPFPGGIIPAAGSPGCGVTRSCINPTGQAILNYFPSPFTGAALSGVEATSGNSYNYQYQDIINDPKIQTGLRIDYNPTDKNSFSATLRSSVMDQRGWANIIGGPAGANFQNFYGHYRFGERGGVLSFRRVINSSIVNELSAGYASTTETGARLTPTSWDHITRSKVGLEPLGQLFPVNNPNDLIPNLHFNLPNSQTGPNFGLDVNNRFPIIGYDTNIDVLDNLSYSRGAHLFKVGFYYEHATSYRGLQGQSRGDFTWSADANDPTQTGNPFADALIGHFNRYIEATKIASAKNVAQDVEWFGQDSWKVKPRLTLELGLRMGMASPWVFIHGDAAGFYPESYNKAAAALLFVPRCVGDTLSTPAHNCGAATNRRAMNPVTGQIQPAALIGFYISTDPTVLSNGSFAATQPGYTHGFTTGTGLQLSPRAGFAWDIFGNGKTALRGNAAIMKNMISSNGTFVNGGKVNPPTTFNPTSFYGNINAYAGQPGFLGQAGFLSPGNVTGWSREYKPPTVYQYGLSVQHELARNTILDVAYVGNMTRFLPETKGLNTLPYGTRFLPSSGDPTNNGVLIDTLNPALSYPGYNGVTESFWNGSSNYNALQVQLNRRFSKYVLFGGAYTWSKTMDYGNSLPVYLNARARNYGLSGTDQAHVLTFNYTYYLPQLSRLIDKGFVREMFDGWTFSGITTFADGTPGSVNFATVNNVDWSGGGDGQRVNLTAPVQLSRSDRTYGKYIAIQNIAMPAKGDPGNAGRVNFRQPGVNNWDMNISKTFPLGSEKRNLLFRWEAYNVFNKTQFSSVNSTATFNTATGALSVPTSGATAFGAVNPATARNPRIMQGSLRLSF